MSFMFNPTDYSDPAAINVLNPAGLDLESACFGTLSCASKILASEANIIGIDGYATAPYCVMENMLQQAAQQAGIPLTLSLIHIYAGRRSLWEYVSHHDGRHRSLLQSI